MNWENQDFYKEGGMKIGRIFFVFYNTLAALYTDSRGVGCAPEAEDILIITPLFFSNIPSMTILVIYNINNITCNYMVIFTVLLSLHVHVILWSYSTITVLLS